MGSSFDIADLPRVAGPANIVGRRELEAHEYNDVHRVLSTVPGVYIRSEDGFGLRPNIGMRGVNPERSAKLTLMEDGVLVAPAPYSAPAVYQFPMTTRLVGIDVYKGPASLRYGPRTIGGVIDLHTREIPETNTMIVDVAGGRFGFAKGHALWGTTYKGFGVLLEAAHLQSRGFKQLDGGGDTGFAKNDAMAKLSYETRSGPETVHRISIKGGYGTDDANETYLGLSHGDFERTPYRRYAATARDRIESWCSQAAIEYFVGDPVLNLETRAYRNDSRRVWRRLDHFRDGPSLSAVLADPDAPELAGLADIIRGDADSTTPEQALMFFRNQWTYASQGVQSTMHWHPHWRWVEQELEVGMRLHGDSITRHDDEDAFLMTSGRLVPQGSDTTPARRNRGQTTALATHVYDVLTLGDRVTIAGGARVEVISMRFYDELAQTSAARVDTPITPGIGAIVQIMDGLGVFAGAHRGFSPVAPGQPKSVKTEVSMNYEAGLRVIRDKLVAEVAGFANDYRNMNGTCSFGPDCGGGDDLRQFNAGKVLVWGVEGLVKHRQTYRRGVHLEVGAQYTYAGSRFRSRFHSNFGQWGDVEIGYELPYMPEHVGGGFLGVGGRIWDVSASPSYTGPMRDIAGRGPIPESVRLDGYFLLDLSAEVRVLERLRLYVQMGNVTASKYVASRRPFGIRPGAPLTFMLGLEARVFG